MRTPPVVWPDVKYGIMTDDGRFLARAGGMPEYDRNRVDLCHSPEEVLEKIRRVNPTATWKYLKKEGWFLFKITFEHVAMEG